MPSAPLPRGFFDWEQKHYEKMPVQGQVDVLSSGLV
jgi:hypothetical protein